MDNIKVCVSICDEEQTFSFSFIRDYTQYAKALIDCNNVFDSTGENMTEENIYKFFSEGEFTYDEIEKLNGDHFLFGFIESLAQSESCPDCLYSYEGNLKFKVTKVQ